MAKTLKELMLEADEVDTEDTTTTEDEGGDDTQESTDDSEQPEETDTEDTQDDSDEDKDEDSKDDEEDEESDNERKADIISAQVNLVLKEIQKDLVSWPISKVKKLRDSLEDWI
jgi:TATA-binding protein-associated factor Taf7